MAGNGSIRKWRRGSDKSGRTKWGREFRVAGEDGIRGARRVVLSRAGIRQRQLASDVAIVSVAAAAPRQNATQLADRLKAGLRTGTDRLMGGQQMRDSIASAFVLSALHGLPQKAGDFCHAAPADEENQPSHAAPNE